MNGALFLIDFSHMRRAILVSTIVGKANIAAKEAAFIKKARNNDFTAKQIAAMRELTGLSPDELLSYDRGSEKQKGFRLIYKGIMCEFDSTNFEVIFRKLDWNIIDRAKVNDVITMKEFERQCKEKIDKREVL